MSLPAARLEPSTVVTAITPSSDTWPENLLRFYIHFSAPMSRRGAIGFVSLVDEKGRKLADVFLEVNANLWNSDDTRFTVLFDPGRVKRGILPNLELGRAIRDRGRYAIVIDAAWRDAAGQPLKEGYRREVKVGLPIERPSDASRLAYDPTKSRHSRSSQRDVPLAAGSCAAAERHRRVFAW